MNVQESEAIRALALARLEPVTFLQGGLVLEDLGVAAPGAWALVDPDLASLTEAEQRRRFYGQVYFVRGACSLFSLTDALGPGTDRPEPETWWSLNDAATILNRHPGTIRRLCREGRLTRRLNQAGELEVSGHSLYRALPDPARLVRVHATPAARLPAPPAPGHTPDQPQHRVVGGVTEPPLGGPPIPLPGSGSSGPREQFGQTRGRPTFYDPTKPTGGPQ